MAKPFCLTDCREGWIHRRYQVVVEEAEEDRETVQKVFPVEVEVAKERKVRSP